MKKFFYIVSERDNLNNILHIKIGITNNIKKRLITIQTSNPNNIILEHTEEREDAYELEQWLLSNFKRNIKKGEWLKDIEIKDIRKKIFEFHD